MCVLISERPHRYNNKSFVVLTEMSGFWGRQYPTAFFSTSRWSNLCLSEWLASSPCPSCSGWSLVHPKTQQYSPPLPHEKVAAFSTCLYLYHSPKFLMPFDAGHLPCPEKTQIRVGIPITRTTRFAGRRVQIRAGTTKSTRKVFGYCFVGRQPSIKGCIRFATRCDELIVCRHY